MIIFAYYKKLDKLHPPILTTELIKKTGIWTGTHNRKDRKLVPNSDL